MTSAVLDALTVTPDRVVWSSLGLITSGALVLLWAGVRLTRGVEA